MSDSIERQAAIDVLDEIRHALWEIDIPSPTVPEYVEHHEQVQSVWKLLDKKQKELYLLPSAQSKKFSEVLQDMMDEDYYLFCHTGHSRLAEKDWVWLIEQVKEMEQKGRTDDCI